MTSARFAVSDFWTECSNPAMKKLLMGSVGGPHLLDCACRSLDHDPQLAVELFMAAWCASPLDGKTASTLCAVEGLLPLLPESMAKSVRGVAENWKRPDNLSYFMRLAGRREHEKLGSYIMSCLEREPGNVFWIQQGLIHAAYNGDCDFASSVLEPIRDEMRAAWQALQGWFLYLAGKPSEALTLISSAGNEFGIYNYANLAATIALECGDREGAISMLGGTISVQPWRSSEILRLHDLKLGLDSDLADIPGSLAVLLYSYNKAAELDATLASIAGSDLGEARLFVLDNGSMDNTADVLDRWQDAFGERMKRIDLPVNVGAAAARNWLMNDPDVAECDFVLYLDDDVELPGDWLKRLGAAVERYPDAGAWGCRVVDHGAPRVMQSVDLHIIQPEGAEGDGPEVDLANISPNPFKVSGLHHQGLDAGAFDFMRPCASVTGCCHLFRTHKLLDNGGFSLFLSPSQYDDMEHDLRLCLKGEWPAYQGHLRILHRKKTGSASRVSTQQESNAIGNKYKMQAMHPRSEILRIMAEEERLLLRDLAEKIDYLVQQGAVTRC